MNADATLRRLADTEAIRDLARRYAHCVWQQDVSGIVALFAEDCVMDTGDRAPLRGRAALLETYTAVFTKDEFHPMVHNHILEFEPADTRRASGTCYLALEAVIDGVRMQGHGFYRDCYVRLSDTWKFESRTLTMSHLAPEPRGRV